MKKPSTLQKMVYIGIISALTSTTLSATYWQFNRYKQSKARWTVIKEELNKDEPQQLLDLLDKEPQDRHVYPYRYVKFKGRYERDTKQFRVRRSKSQRMGQLIFRPLHLSNGSWIIALEGWIPEEFSYTPKPSETKQFIGLIRQSEKPGTYDKKESGINLHADTQQVSAYFKKQQKSGQRRVLETSHMMSRYYVQILKPMTTANPNEETYPYQYSIDNFELPYLTPDKHRAYFAFWGLTSCVGIYAIVKVILM